jgi:selenoprotein W-related protein
LTDELLQKYTSTIESLELLPSGGGRFEVKVGNQLIFSKKSFGRHAETNEVAQLFEEATGVAPLSQDS